MREGPLLDMSSYYNLRVISKGGMSDSFVNYTVNLSVKLEQSFVDVCLLLILIFLIM